MFAYCTSHNIDQNICKFTIDNNIQLVLSKDNIKAAIILK